MNLKRRIVPAAGIAIVLAMSVTVASQSQRRVDKTDPLLGKWASVALEGGDQPVFLDFQPNGRVNMKSGNEPIRHWFYKREPYGIWQKRRNAELRNILMPAEYRTFLKWQPKPDPSYESVSVSPTQGEYPDSGMLVMILDPKGEALYNPIASFFTRPGLVSTWKHRLNAMREAGDP